MQLMDDDKAARTRMYLEVVENAETTEHVELTYHKTKMCRQLGFTKADLQGQLRKFRKHAALAQNCHTNNERAKARSWVRHDARDFRIMLGLPIEADDNELREHLAEHEARQ